MRVLVTLESFVSSVSNLRMYPWARYVNQQASSIVRSHVCKEIDLSFYLEQEEETQHVSE